jgi:NDP-sugar pyrophosphorylase family protein
MDPLAPESFFDLEAFEHRALFQDAQYVWQALARLKSYMASLEGRDIRGRVSPGAWIEGDGIVIEEGAVVGPGACIQGPAIIGPEAEVRHGAFLRGNVLLGRGALVGHATEVKGSVFLNGAKAGHFAYVGDSLLGKGVNLGAGTKLANLRLDRANVTISHNGHRIDTELRKLGAILGDGCELGCNVVTNPGTLLGKACRVFPAIAVHGVHAAFTTLMLKDGWMTASRAGDQQ